MITEDQKKNCRKYWCTNGEEKPTRDNVTLFTLSSHRIKFTYRENNIFHLALNRTNDTLHKLIRGTHRALVSDAKRCRIASFTLTMKSTSPVALCITRSHLIWQAQKGNGVIEDWSVGPCNCFIFQRISKRFPQEISPFANSSTPLRIHARITPVWSLLISLHIQRIQRLEKSLLSFYIFVFFLVMIN